MKFTQVYSKYNLLVGILCMVILLPGCGFMDWFSSDKPTASTKEQATNSNTPALQGETLVSLDGKVLITTESLKKEKADLMASNPQLKMMIPHMDEKQFDKTLVDGLTNQAVVEKYIHDNKLDQTAEYANELALMMKSIKHMFNNKVFSAQLKPSVSESDIVDFYEKNKSNIPTLVLSHGGVKAVGVEFDTETAAKDFLTKVQAAGNAIQKAAETAKLTDKVRDFKTVNSQSVGLDTNLREKIVATTKVPSTALHKISDKSYWVVTATSKEAPTYQPLEKIKSELRQYLEKEKLTELVDKELTELRKKYNVEINEQYFAPAKEEVALAEQDVEAFDTSVQE